MFSLTTKAQYGISAVLELAANHGRGPVKIREVAVRHRIPRNYLEQILHQLHRHEIVRSVRGRKGGYELAADPSAVTLLQVLEALDGRVKLESTGVPRSVEELLLGVIGELREALDVPVAEIAARQQVHQGPMFYI